MKIEGSCYCGAVKFSVVSYTPYPFMRCYCSICRKTAGAGGYAINIMAQADTLKIQGEANIAHHQARLEDPDNPGKKNLSSTRRHFCRNCGSPLWVAHPEWKEWVYPFASSIDTPLPTPPERVHLMLDFKAPWCEVPSGKADQQFALYPGESIADWHKRRGLYQEP